MSIRDEFVRHKYALRVICATTSLDFVFGVAFGYSDHIGFWNGLYFATTTASTVGYGDIIPRGWLPHAISVAIMLTVIPLLGATFSLFTSGLTSTHVERSEKRIKEHLVKHVTKLQ